ncbi:MAG: hypothetical protein JWP75_2166 [Frondihabitans sp.]|nr:hypothetical protein [Frondihabitans sp.]
MNGSRVPGFPRLGRTVPAIAVTGLGVVAGAIASLVVVGLSGWLVVALLLLFAAAALPRGPFVAVLVVQLAAAQVLVGAPGYTGRFALVLLASHLMFTTGALSVWLPRRAHVQLRVLRVPLLRFVAVQAAAQAVSFVVLALVRPANATSFVWLGIVGAAAALVLALTVLAPALLRPATD